MNVNDVVIKRVRLLMKRENVLQKQLAVDLNLPITTLNNYLVKKAEFRNEVIVKIALYFDVTTDYLFGLTQIPEKTTNLTQDIYFLEHAIKIMEKDLQSANNLLSSIKNTTNSLKNEEVSSCKE